MCNIFNKYIDKRIKAKGKGSIRQKTEEKGRKWKWRQTNIYKNCAGEKKASSLRDIRERTFFHVKIYSNYMKKIVLDFRIHTEKRGCKDNSGKI